MTNQDQTKIVEQLAKRLIKINKLVSVAESCTGGWVAKVLTDIAGSSDWFERGFVTYSNLAKQEMLGVAESTLQKYGAVSEETVSEMAKIDAKIQEKGETEQKIFSGERDAVRHQAVVHALTQLQNLIDMHDK